MSTTAVKKMLARAVKLDAPAAARVKAEALLMLRAQIKATEIEITALEEDLRDYVLDSGEVNIGPLLAYERTNPPKMVGASGKMLESHTAQLVNQFPDYAPRKLDLSMMLAALDTNLSLKDALKVRGLEIVRGSGWYFKVVKAEEATV